MVEGVTLVLDFTGPDGQPRKPPDRIVACGACGKKRYASASLHSVIGDGAGRLIDCARRRVVLNGIDFVLEAA